MVWKKFVILGYRMLFVKTQRNMNSLKMCMAVWAGICVAVFLACHPGKSRLEEALEAAGENRSELEQVLDHYRGDSLKSLAAQFLIENMPCHYAYAGKELEKYRRYFERFPPCAWRGPEFVRDSLLEVDGAFCPDSLYKVYDIHVIKSDYLIRNIDQAFEVWHGQPWGRHVDFADFLEFILPYRVGTETLSDWRQEVYDRYNPMLDSIRASADSTDVLAVAQVLMDSLSVGTVYFTGLFPSGITVGPDLVEWRSGNCRELTDLVTYVFRALGIPGGCDKMLMRGDKNVAHYWNFVVDGEDSTYFASIGQSSKLFAKAETYWDPKGKVYRETFSLNRAMRDACGRDTTDVPPVFREPLMQDVTAAYAGKINRFLRIPADSLALVPHAGETVYLCLATRGTWVPVGYGRFEGDTVRIDNVQGDVVFRQVVCRKGHLVSLGVPFLLEKYTGAVRFFRAGEERQKAVLLQKFKEDFQAHMVGGVFEASDHPDFRCPDTLFAIKGRPPRLRNVVCLPDKGEARRYVRYYGPPTRHCNVSELAFYVSAADTAALCGRIVSPPGVAEGRIVNQFGNVFDGDPYTSMDYREPSGGWVGMDFGRPMHIGKLVYMPRNRDNFIRTGDRYELFYATAAGWESLGEQTAESDSLVYKVPRGALLYLRDHTRGSDDRIFEMVDGRQKLW